MVSTLVRSSWWPRRSLCLLAAGSVAALLAGTESADARRYGAYSAYGSYKAKRARTEPRTADKKEKTKAAAAEPVHLIVISIPKQRISVFGARGLIAQSAVSTGRTGYPTPIGVFSIIQKNRYHRSNIYSGAPMPYMQRITWSGVAMHEGVLPGYPASHGCIRLTHAFASQLWGMTRMGVRVIVTPDDGAPSEISHARLPAPAMVPAPTDVAEAEQVKPALMAMAGDKTEGAPPATPVKLVGPLERAKAERARIVAEAPARAKAAKAAAETAAAKAAEANRAIAAVREAEQAAAAARARRDAAARALAAAATPEALEQAKAALGAAEARLAEAVESAQGAVATEAARTRDAFAATLAAWEAERDSDAAAAVIRAGERALEPISVFVSRKTGRVHVRQAWVPVHEAPVTIKDPETPLGTHVYVATEQPADGNGMRWLAMTYPQTTAGPESKDKPRSRRRGDRDDDSAAPEPRRPRETAAGALDRIELPEETRKFIADRLWAGASLIVSDYGLSNEAGKFTDFIVQPR